MRLVLFVAMLATIAIPATQKESTAELLAVQDALQSNDLERASALVDQALARHGQTPGLLNLRGIVHAQRQEMDAARSDFRSAVRLSPNLVPAWQNLARACGADLACAESAWQQVLRLKPSDNEATAALADVRVGRSDQLAAAGQTRESEREAAESISLAQGLAKGGTASIATLQTLALAQERLKKFVDSRATLEQVAARDPQNPAHLIELARVAELNKDFRGALGYLAHARDLAPENPQIHFLFAMAADALELPIEARTSLERALAIEPDNAAYNYALGYEILQTRDAATAAGYFEKAVHARPQEPKGHYALGVAYFAAGDYPRAKAELTGIAHDAKTSGGAAYFLGRMAYSEDDLDAAAQYLETAIRLLPAYSEAHTALAKVQLRQGKSIAAFAQIEKALRLDPKSFGANSELLVWYRRTKDARAEQQSKIVKQLDEERSRRAELMLRTIEVRP